MYETRLGQGRKVIRIEIHKETDDMKGYRGMIVTIEGGFADIRTERAIIDAVRWDSQGSAFMPTEEEDGESNV